MTNGKKIFLLFILCVITFVLGIVGKNSFNNGHGNIGSIRYKLLPIQEEFMRLDTVIRNGNIKAEYNNDKIIIKYNNSKYEYLYFKENNKEFIKSSYNLNDKDGELIAKCMIEAVNKINGGNKTLFIKYDMFDFLNSNIENGVSIKATDKYEITIDINKNISESFNKSK